MNKQTNNVLFVLLAAPNLPYYPQSVGFYILMHSDNFGAISQNCEEEEEEKMLRKKKHQQQQQREEKIMIDTRSLNLCTYLYTTRIYKSLFVAREKYK